MHMQPNPHVGRVLVLASPSRLPCLPRRPNACVLTIPLSVVLLGCFFCPRLRAGFAPAFFCLPVLTQPGGRVGYGLVPFPLDCSVSEFIYEAKDGRVPPPTTTMGVGGGGLLSSSQALINHSTYFSFNTPRANRPAHTVMGVT